MIALAGRLRGEGTFGAGFCAFLQLRFLEIAPDGASAENDRISTQRGRPDSVEPRASAYLQLVATARE